MMTPSQLKLFACLAALGCLLSALPGRAAPPTTEHTQPRTITPAEERAWTRHTRQALDQVEPRLAAQVTWIVEELWSQGWAAQVSSAHRTLEAQRESFESGYSKTLRSKHLCGKAVDFNLHPHDFPDVDHPFWDAKDELAHTQKLLTLDAPSFRDRPHVELNEDCDWDSVSLGPAGTWISGTQTLLITRTPEGQYTGRLTTPTHIYRVMNARVSHRHSGERGKVEHASVTVTLKDEESDEESRRVYEVSTVTSPAHGYQRADWRWLATTEPAQRLERATP